MPSRSLTFHQEIRDAIAARERLVLVVGPKAVTSDYVRQEWQFALREADKVVTPILRLGDYPLRSRRAEAAPLRGLPRRRRSIPSTSTTWFASSASPRRRWAS